MAFLLIILPKQNFRQLYKMKMKKRITGVLLWNKDPDPGNQKRPDPNPQHC